MDSALFLKYKTASNLTTKAVQRVNPCYEIAKLFVIELNKTAGQEYVTKAGKKGKTKTYTELMVMSDLKAINKEPHTMHAFYEDCIKSNLGFRFYYCAKLKKN
jgi:hypothetical protein